MDRGLVRCCCGPMARMKGLTMAEKPRTLELYSIHGRVRDTVISYDALLAGIGQLDRVSRQAEVGNRVVAITEFGVDAGSFALRFVAGIAGEPALFYDTATGEESQLDTGSRIVASSAWTFVDAASRLVAIERRRPGVSILEIESALEQLGDIAGLGAGLRIDLNPVAASSFLDEVAKLDRIREATVVLRRPNLDWDDNASTLTGYAAESGGDRVSIDVSAGRGRSLSTDQGIVADIKRFVRRPIAAMKSVRVKGSRSGEERERTVSLDKHQERRFVPVVPGETVRESLFEAATEMIRATSERTPDLIDVDISD